MNIKWNKNHEKKRMNAQTRITDGVVIIINNHLLYEIITAQIELKIQREKRS